MKLLGVLVTTAISSFAATVSQMSGTQFSHSQFGAQPQAGIPVPALIAIGAGMIGLFAFLRKPAVRTDA